MKRSEWTAPAVAGCGLLAVSLALPWLRVGDQTNLGDIRHYRAIAEHILDGHMPYHGFFVEYPPGALPVFLAPTAFDGKVGSYGIAFRILAALAAAVVVLAVAATAPRLGKGAMSAALFVGIAPALLGPVFLERYDVWAAALTSLALLAFLRGRTRTSAVLIGLGAVVKVYPALLVPLFLIRLAVREGRRAALAFAAIVCGVFAIVVLPFAVIAPGGVAYSFKIQLTRVLEIESIGGAALLSAQHLALYTPTVYEGLSWQLVGTLPDLVGVLQTLLLALGLVAAWWGFFRSPHGDADLVLAAAAVIVVTVTFNKVLSPQYLVWIVPLVALVRGTTGALARVLTAVACLMTLAYFPWHFRDLYTGGTSAWIVLVRDFVLVALGGLLLTALLRGPPSRPVAAKRVVHEVRENPAGDADRRGR